MTTVADDRGLRWRLISRTGGYALRVVLYVARSQNGSGTSAREAAAALDIPPCCLGRVLAVLGQEGLLVSTGGPPVASGSPARHTRSPSRRSSRRSTPRAPRPDAC